MNEWKTGKWVKLADYRDVETNLIQSYQEGTIDYDDLPQYLQDQIREEWLWDQADAMYDMNEEYDNE
jgi:hypothetical protein